MPLKLFKEFKEFAVKGNMMDIAIGVIIGAAFNKVIDVLVKEVLLPPLSLLTDAVNFEDKKWILRDEVIQNDVVTTSGVAISYGKLIEVTVDFLIIGFTVFIIVKLMNKLKNRAQDTDDLEVKTPKDIELLNKISTLLEQQNELMNSKKQEK
ncbi:large conductance mechanosensitive channel protein MscL [Dokdonia sp.]|uniref:large conductance mechanosensitive channel protein MscL n=1 Tax=Dokdonia sp. TaxID=2024995 RepID=UPI0032636E35